MEPLRDQWVSDPLWRNRQQLQSFVEQAPLSIAMLDRDMKYLAYSRRWLQEYGRGYANLVGFSHLLQDRLQQALDSSGRSGKHGALLCVDLDDFKSLDDSMRRTIGDLLLKQFATRLKSSVRKSDSVARLGGDEFVVLVEELSANTAEAAQQTEAISAKIFSVLSTPYWFDAHQYRCTASIGATVFNGPETAKDELIKQTDIAMYQAKKSERN